MEHRLEFPPARRRNNPIGEGHQSKQGDPNLAGQNDDHDPPGQLRHEGECNQGTTDENLVGNRIENDARVGDQVSLARQSTIESVGSDGGDEQPRGDKTPDPVLSVIEQHQPDKQWCEQNPHHGDDVGDVAVGDLGST